MTWWDNKIGTREVFFRASTDAGETFGNTIMLNLLVREALSNDKPNFHIPESKILQREEM